MPKTKDSKKLWQKSSLKRKDVLLSFVTVVAILGGVMVFQSYAGHNQDTTKAGAQVKLSKIDVNDKEQPYLYQFSTTAGLTYCFVGEVPSGGSVGITVTYGEGAIHQTVTQSRPDTEIGCFKANESSDDTTVTLDINRDMKPKELRVYQR